MKKFTDLLKPNILIIFGALLFLYFLNYLSMSGEGLAIGIIAVILSAYYLTIGILGIFLGNKFSTTVKKVLEVISVSLFAAFKFVMFLLTTISASKIDGLMGPTAWTIQILSMVAAVGLVCVYSIAKFNSSEGLLRFALLFSLIFALALLLDILFQIDGSSTLLGQVDILFVVIYAIYCFYLFSTLGKGEPAKVQEQPKEEKAE